MHTSDFIIALLFSELENSLGRHQVSVSLDPEEESPIDLIGVYEDMGDIHHKMEAITEEFEVHTYIDESVID